MPDRPRADAPGSDGPGAPKAADAFRTISEVADALGTPAHVLRFWETKFTQVKPVKRAGGRRYYRPADVELLEGIRKLLHDDGLTIRGVQKILKEEGVRQVAVPVPPREAEAPRPALEAKPAPVPEAKPAATSVIAPSIPVAAPSHPAPAAPRKPAPSDAPELPFDAPTPSTAAPAPSPTELDDDEDEAAPTPAPTGRALFVATPDRTAALWLYSTLARMPSGKLRRNRARFVALIPRLQALHARLTDGAPQSDE